MFAAPTRELPLRLSIASGGIITSPQSRTVTKAVEHELERIEIDAAE
jgi:hypothetical protein